MRFSNKTIVFLIVLLVLHTTYFVTAADSISDYQEQQKEILNQIENGKNDLEEKNEKKETTSEVIKELDDHLASLQNGLNTLEEQVAGKEESIRYIQEELNKAKEAEDGQYDQLKKRIKFMYETGDTNYLDVLFRAESLSDFLNRADYVKAMMEYDEDLFHGLKSTREGIEGKEEQLQSEKSDLVKLKDLTEQQKNAMAQTRVDKTKELETLEYDIDKQKEYLEELEKEQKEVESIISKMIAESNQLKYEGGELEWPVPGYYRISSGYGQRSDPFTGITDFHTGIDIPAPTGTKVIAAASGKVIHAGWINGYGYTVMINHGSNLVTLYGHNSALTVEAGQAVVRGQQIAKIGMTGRATGPHCHFEVRVNGSHTSPWEYLGEQ